MRRCRVLLTTCGRMRHVTLPRVWLVMLPQLLVGLLLRSLLWLLLLPGAEWQVGGVRAAPERKRGRRGATAVGLIPRALRTLSIIHDHISALVVIAALRIALRPSRCHAGTVTPSGGGIPLCRQNSSSVDSSALAARRKLRGNAHRVCINGRISCYRTTPSRATITFVGALQQLETGLSKGWLPLAGAGALMGAAALPVVNHKQASERWRARGWVHGTRRATKGW